MNFHHLVVDGSDYRQLWFEDVDEHECFLLSMWLSRDSRDSGDDRLATLRLEDLVSMLPDFSTKGAGMSVFHDELVGGSSDIAVQWRAGEFVDRITKVFFAWRGGES